MNFVDEIIARKIADRCCRRSLHKSELVEDIVKECCEELNLSVPKIVYCETLTRSLSAFYLRGQPYLLYDSCLIETLYIYDCIILSGADQEDMKKLFFKLIGEELILKNDLPKSLYFSGKYRQMSYLFEGLLPNFEHQANQMISAQTYFLIGHELCHLRLNKDTTIGLPDDYWKFARACMQVLTKRALADSSFDEFINTRYGYFMDECPSTLDEYYANLWKSNKFRHFVEECYCDLQGLKLLLEHYNDAENSVKAISAVLIYYLLLQESVRSNIAENQLFFGDGTREVNRSTYYSLLRMEFLMVTIQFNGLDHIEEAFLEIYNRSVLSRYWSDLMEKIPEEESFKSISEADLPPIDRKALINSLINTFYYAHIE